MTCPVWNTGCEWKENEDWWLLDMAGREAQGKGESFVLEAAFLSIWIQTAETVKVLRCDVSVMHIQFQIYLD